LSIAFIVTFSALMTYTYSINKLREVDKNMMIKG
jgi:hypothetical protein